MIDSVRTDRDLSTYPNHTNKTSNIHVRTGRDLSTHPNHKNKTSINPVRTGRDLSLQTQKLTKKFNIKII